MALFSDVERDRYKEYSGSQMLQYALGDDYDDGLKEVWDENYGREYKTRSKVAFAIYERDGVYIVLPVMFGYMSNIIRQIYSLTVEFNSIEDAQHYVKTMGKKLHSVIDRTANKIRVNPRQRYTELDLDDLD